MPILGSVPVSGFVAPTSEFDVYPSHKALYGHGGHRTVADLLERDSITPERREEGMTVYCIADGTTYRLEGGITNTDWSIATGSGTPSSGSVGELDGGDSSTSYAVVDIDIDGGGA
jgi:hypothetical protein